MRKIVLLLSLFFAFNSSYAVDDITKWLKDIPSNFNFECYELSTKIDSSNFIQWVTYYLNLNRSDIIVTQKNKILPVKLSYQKDWLYNAYSIETEGFSQVDYRNLKDNNSKTFLELNIWSSDLIWDEIEIKLDNKIQWYSSSFNFLYKSDYYNAEFYIKDDWNQYKKVTKQNITDFSFSYLKIKFVSKTWYNNWKQVAEKVLIEELSFLENETWFLFRSFFDDDINIYSWYNCNDFFRVSPNPFNSFSTDKNTKTVNAILTKNSKYNVYVWKDIDNDWVLDQEDNCKSVYNPMQKDSNADWKWDLCSDDDNDGIIWINDNCISISNSDQKDLNRNWVWDVCEFDKDEDTIFDSQDNCINIKNIGQDDDDKDWIWNLCDNCKLYNPRQLDKNNSWVWDTCEQQDKFLLENDDDNDWVLNSIDNCRDIENKDQRDTDKDWIWDSCDNCKNIQNPKQTDLNENGVWDMCEDSDNDWIDGLVDNCLNIANPDQKDSDNNWVWDICEDNDNDWIIFAQDNCPYIYNPDQKDTDQDNIGDKCDETDDRFIESNKNIFIGFMVFVALLFFVWILFMLKKLWNTKIDDK